MAETKNKKQPLGVPETKGAFEFAGYVSGVSRENFYTEKNTRSNKPRRVLSFAVQYDAEHRAYVELAGMEQKSVWFSKKNAETIEVPWRERQTFSQEGYSMIGTRIGIETVVDKNGTEKNKNKVFAPFDACLYASQHLQDEMPVYVRGNLTYSSYKDNNGDIRHSKKFEPSQISRSSRPVNFEDPKFESINSWTQRIVFMGIAPAEEKGRYILSAKVITRNTVEDVEFIVLDADFAKSLKKNIKPYTALDVFGYVNISKNEEEDTSEDVGFYLGGKNKMNRKSAPTVIELVCTGGDGSTIDTEMYNEENVDAAILAAKRMRDAKADFGEEDDSAKSNWGAGKNLNASNEDDEDEAWD